MKDRNETTFIVVLFVIAALFVGVILRAQAIFVP